MTERAPQQRSRCAHQSMLDDVLDGHALVPTERINPQTEMIDLLPLEAMLGLINAADQQVPLAVQKAIPQIARMVEKVVQAFETGGHLYYIGAGTSGRLGVLDAAECPPTFSSDPGLVQGIMAGGDRALHHAVEGAEDDAKAGEQAIRERGISGRDVVIGLSASGGPAYVLRALEVAKQLGAYTGAITCHPKSLIVQIADVAMVAEVGPEVLTGSTRMKAGTAQKLILNMISTGAMIAWGKTYRNLMVDVKPTNKKLRERAIRLVSMLGKSSSEEAEATLVASQWQVKPAVVMLTLNQSLEEAQQLLKQYHGKLRAVLEAQGDGS